MRQVIHDRHGDPAEVLRVVDAPDPEPGPGEVRVRMQVMTLNPADLLAIEGRYGAAPGPLPAIPGMGGFGVIDKLGAGVEALTKGQPVLTFGPGQWQDLVVLPAARAVSAPEGADPEQAAMMRANPATAELMLALRPLAPGDWVAQNAANSSVGRHVVRFAREKGLRTVNIVRRPEAAEPLNADGADAVVVHDGAEGLTDALLQATQGARPKLAFDAVGGAQTGALAAALDDGGLVALYGLLSGEDSRVSALDIVFRRVSLQGFWLADWFAAATPDETRALHATLAERLARGLIRSEVAARYPLDRVREAVSHAAQPGRDGKIVLTGD